MKCLSESPAVQEQFAILQTHISASDREAVDRQSDVLHATAINAALEDAELFEHFNSMEGVFEDNVGHALARLVRERGELLNKELQQSELRLEVATLHTKVVQMQLQLQLTVTRIREIEKQLGFPV